MDLSCGRATASGEWQFSGSLCNSNNEGRRGGCARTSEPFKGLCIVFTGKRWHSVYYCWITEALSVLTTVRALELPCTLTFTANSIMVSKVEALQATIRVDSSVGPGYPHNVDDNSPINENLR